MTKFSGTMLEILCILSIIECKSRETTDEEHKSTYRTRNGKAVVTGVNINIV